MYRQNDSPEKGKTMLSTTNNKAWSSGSQATGNNNTKAAALRSVVFGGFKFVRHASQEADCFVPEPIPTERLLERYADKIKQARVSQEDARSVIQDSEQFRKLQQILRQQNCMSNGTLKINLHLLLQDRLKEMKLQEKNPLAKPTPSPDKLPPVSLLQKLTSPKMRKDSGDRSPTSATATIQFESEQKGNLPQIDVSDSKEDNKSDD